MLVPTALKAREGIRLLLNAVVTNGRGQRGTSTDETVVINEIRRASISDPNGSNLYILRAFLRPHQVLEWGRDECNVTLALQP